MRSLTTSVIFLAIGSVADVRSINRAIPDYTHIKELPDEFRVASSPADPFTLGRATLLPGGVPLQGGFFNIEQQGAAMKV